MTSPSWDVLAGLAQARWMRLVVRILDVVVRIRRRVRKHPGHGRRRSERRTTSKDFCDALYHLDQLSVAPSDFAVLRHRLELERILLAAYADRREDERPPA